MLFRRLLQKPNPIFDKYDILPVHKHPLVPSARFFCTICSGCFKTGHNYGGYYCPDECYEWYHKECAEAALEINHPSHPQHPLILELRIREVRKCALCGITGWSRGYRCSLCDFEVDVACARKSPPLLLAIEPPSHDDQCVISKEQKAVVPRCEVCKDNSEDYKSKNHMGCANLPQEVNHLSHPKHPLMLVSSESLSDVPDKTCLLCGGEASGEVLYHCSTCNYTLCPFCARNPPPLTIEHPKTHNHQLTLWPRKISFTCNVCGLQGDQSPYICFPCDFVIHRECFDLPRVININRHDHRVSFTNRVGISNAKCGVCRKSVNQYYGGYSCSTCANYAVHSQCAVKYGIWDMIELEGIPEDPIIPPYIVVGDNLIQHFSHEKHILRLHQDDVILDASSRCQACVRPFFSDRVYSCERCDFMLHETCANLPMRKRLVFSIYAYQLSIEVSNASCESCGIIFNGFMYRDTVGHRLDVSCGSFSEPFFFDGHSHSLYYKKSPLGSWGAPCVACEDLTKYNTLCCDDCDFQVHLGCANLPKRVKHRSDDHHLTLCYGEGEDASGKYWCDICEWETDPKKWFYTCSECGVTMHIKCVVGDFSRLMPNSTVMYGYKDTEYKVVPNNKSDRPICDHCRFRCLGPFTLQFSDKGYVCSLHCLKRDYLWTYGSY